MTEPKKPRSGTKWDETHYKEKGWRRYNVRVPPEESIVLERVASIWGVTPQKAIRHAISMMDRTPGPKKKAAKNG